MTRAALYAGSFDPVTSGHLDVLMRGLELFDRVLVGVAENPRKSTLFSAEERVELIREAVGDNARIRVEVFEGLLVDYARQKGVTAVLRGLRAVSDFEYEFQMASMNRNLAPGIQAVFLMAAEEHFYVSSSLVKEVALLGGAVDDHAPHAVVEALQRKREELTGAR